MFSACLLDLIYYNFFADQGENYELFFFKICEIGLAILFFEVFFVSEVGHAHWVGFWLIFLFRFLIFLFIFFFLVFFQFLSLLVVPVEIFHCNITVLKHSFVERMHLFFLLSFWLEIGKIKWRDICFFTLLFILVSAVLDVYTFFWVYFVINEVKKLKLVASYCASEHLVWVVLDVLNLVEA